MGVGQEKAKFLAERSQLLSEGKGGKGFHHPATFKNKLTFPDNSHHQLPGLETSRNPNICGRSFHIRGRPYSKEDKHLNGFLLSWKIDNPRSLSAGLTIAHTGPGV